MDWRRVCFYGLWGLGLVTAVRFWLTLRVAGFPDGYLTELDRVRQPLYAASIGTNGALAAFFLYRGYRLPRLAAGRKAVLSLLAYLVFWGLFWGVDGYILPLYFDSGGGG